MTRYAEALQRLGDSDPSSQPGRSAPIADAAVGAEVMVHDVGLLESALGRPRATVFGDDAYPDLHTKAAALLHSLARNHALVDGNKRLAWAAAACSSVSTATG